MSATDTALPAVITPQIGQAFGGGFFAGIIIENGQRYLNITAGAAHEMQDTWSNPGVIIEGAGSFTDSRSNTESMAVAGSALAQKVLALNINGFTDWAIPARDVQELQYRNFKPTREDNYCWGRDGDNPNSLPAGNFYTAGHPSQSPIPAFQVGMKEAFQGTCYWSSTQRSDDFALLLFFGTGYQSKLIKSCVLRVRPVRRELIID